MKPEEMAEVKLWDGSQIGPGLRVLLEREAVRLELVRDQIHELEKQRKELLKNSEATCTRTIRKDCRSMGALKGCKARLLRRTKVLPQFMEVGF